MTRGYIPRFPNYTHYLFHFIPIIIIIYIYNIPVIPIPHHYGSSVAAHLESTRPESLWILRTKQRSVGPQPEGGPTRSTHNIWPLWKRWKRKLPEDDQDSRSYQKVMGQSRDTHQHHILTHGFVWKYSVPHSQSCPTWHRKKSERLGSHPTGLHPPSIMNLLVGLVMFCFVYQLPIIWVPFRYVNLCHYLRNCHDGLEVQSLEVSKKDPVQSNDKHP